MTKAAAKFDLNALDTVAACNRPFEVEIMSVGGSPTGFFISVLGKDGDVYRGRVRTMADEALRQQATGKRAAETLAQLEAKNIDALVAATTGWRFGDGNTVPLDGEQLEFNAGNARRIYERLLPVREQVSEAINNLENFMPA